MIKMLPIITGVKHKVADINCTRYNHRKAEHVISGY